MFAGSTSAPFLSCDESMNGNLITGASGDDDHQQVEIFDIRGNTNRPICVYNQSHSDLITQVKFLPNSNHLILSGSVDGLMVTYDLTNR